MQYRKGFRTAVMAVAVASAALAMSACQPGEEDAAGAPSAAPGTPAASAPGTPAGSGPSDGTPAGKTPPSGKTPPGKAPKTCAASALKVTAAQAADRPSGTGTGAAVIGFTNVSAKPCVLKGHPSVAGAGNGSPEHNSPLAVTPTGTASPVTVAAGGSAWVKLTFVQVQGEADGYCVSGADPVVYPTLVIGLPDSGSHQVALDDGQFAECDNKVTATAVSAAKPS